MARYRFQSGEQVHEITLERQGEDYQATIDGQACAFELLDTQPGQISLRFGDKSLTLYWAVDGGETWLALDGCTYRLEKPAARAARPGAETGGGETVRAPMPAQVRAVQAAEGDRVEKGQTLLLLEAMKMEIRIRAPSNGILKRLMVHAGDTVEKDQILAQIGE